jgi:hypothetical protein
VGATLLELLIVMTIIATLLGLGVGVFNNLATADRLASGQVQDAMRAARLFALREGAPASVVIDPGEGPGYGVVYGLGLRSVGNWHFEDENGSGWPVPARHDPDSLIEDGVIGSALSVGVGQGLAISDPPARLDSPFGFGLDVYVRPEGEARPMTLLERPGCWAVRLDGEDLLEVTVMLENGKELEEHRRSTTARLPRDRFSRLTVVCDGRSLHIAIDGTRVGVDTRFDRRRQVAVSRGSPVRSGLGIEAFVGAFDELRLGAVITGEHEPLPAEVTLEGAARMLRLDRFGHLDPAHHSAPVVVSFLSGVPQRRTSVEFGLLGSVRTWTSTP